MDIKKHIAESMTGIPENPHGLGKYYGGSRNTAGRVTPGGHEVTPEAAYDLLREGVSVEVPNAGAGSYDDFFRSLGFTEVRSYENSSSAGDWTFVVKDGAEGDWYPAFQSNRYPRHGFEYSVDFEFGYPSFEEFCQCQS